MRKKVIVAVVAALALVAAGGIGWAIARPTGEEPTARGSCGAVSYELSAEREDGGHEVSFELQSEAPGETWRIELTQDGGTLLSGERTTDEDAEIDVDVFTEDGIDDIAVTFTPAGGEPCTATLRR